MEIRPKAVIDLADYGMNGEIVMEPLTFRREIEMKNNLGRCNHYVGTGNELRLEYTDTGSSLIYAVMAYITDAPFDFRSKEGFLNFMDRVDSKCGRASELFKAMQREAERVKNGEVSPFAESGTSPTGTSESS